MAGHKISLYSMTQERVVQVLIPRIRRVTLFGNGVFAHIIKDLRMTLSYI